MRYLVCKLHEKSDKPWSEQEKCGTGPDSQCFQYYMSVDNVIKYGLARPHFKPGIYHIYLWPEGTTFDDKQNPRVAYKRVSKEEVTHV